MEFRRIEDRVRIYTCPGSRTVPEFFKQISDDGVEFLKECGTRDLYDEIQSHKDSVDIHIILAKYASGDTSVLSKKQGMYGDFTKAPTSLVEMIQLVNEADRAFLDLPLEVREKFGSSVARWLAEYGTDAWSEKMGFMDSVNDAVKEVKVDESEQ